MKDMKNKVAVVNFDIPQRTLLAVALTCLTDYQLVQNRHIYEWKRLYQMDENLMNGWDHQVLFISSSFVQRVNSESLFSEFISNGAVFSEIFSLKSKLNEGLVEQYQPHEMTMLDSLLHVAGRYASLYYDQVIHIRNAISANFDEMSVSFYEKHHIAYKLFEGGNDMKTILESVAREVDIPIAQTAEGAIYEAEKKYYLTRKS